MEDASRRSLMNIKNRVGDKTDPWGTPLEIWKVEDVAPSTTTEIERQER